MKLKTSFFNRTVFFKNIKLCWLISLIYLIWLMCYVPLQLWVKFNNTRIFVSLYNYSSGEIVSSDYSAMIEVFDISMHSFVIMMVACLCGITLFNYLFSSKSANMIHALPIGRGELYRTHVVSGLLYMCVPQILTFVVSIFVCLRYGVTDIKQLGIWLLTVFAISVLMFSLVVFSVMFTGNVIAVPIYYLILNFFFVGIRFVLIRMTNVFCVGVFNSYFNEKFNLLSPAVYLFGSCRIEGVFDEEFGNMIGICFMGLKTVGIYGIIGIVILLISGQIYRRRKIESTGDFLAFNILKPLFRWGVGCCGGYTITVFLIMLFTPAILIDKKVLMFIGGTLFGIMLFWGSEMLIQKSFRVLNKRLLKEVLVFECFIIVLCVGSVLYADRLSSKCPDKDEVVTSYVSMDYPVLMEYDEVAYIQKYIVKNYSDITNSRVETHTVSLGYVLADGSRTEKIYEIPWNDEYVNLLKKVFEETNKPENKIAYALWSDDSCITASGCTGSIDFYNEELNEYYSSEFEDEIVTDIIRAYKKDLVEGNVDGALFNYTKAAIEGISVDEATANTDNCNIMINCVVSDPKKYKENWLNIIDESMDDVMKETIADGMTEYMMGQADFSYYKGQYWTYKTIPVTRECENVINVLIKNGIISSKSEVGL